MIVLAKDDAFHIAHLLNFLIQGEVLAFDCAKQQTQLCQNAAQRKFLKRQARQEYFHASVFRMGVGLIKSKSAGSPLGKKPMREYRLLIEEALKRGDLTESLLGMQIILEGLGDVALENTSTHSLDSGATFDRLRSIVLGQEDAHHTFGLRYFKKQFPDEQLIPDYLRSRAKDYMGITHDMLASVQSLFEYFDEDIHSYRQQMTLSLPQWVGG